MQNPNLTPDLGEPIRLTNGRLIRLSRRGTYHLVGLVGDQPRVTSQVVAIDQVGTGQATVGSGQTYQLSSDRRRPAQMNAAIRHYCREHGLPFDFSDETALLRNPDLDFGFFLPAVHYRPHVILLNGPTGVGKAAIGYGLSRIYQARLVTHRDVRALALHMKRHENTPPIKALADARTRRMREEIARGTDDAYVWTDILVSRREEDASWVRQLIDVAATLQARLIAVTLTVDEDVRRKRIAAAGTGFAEKCIELLSDEALIGVEFYARHGIPSITYDTTVLDTRRGAAELAGEIHDALLAFERARGPSAHVADEER